MVVILCGMLNDLNFISEISIIGKLTLVLLPFMISQVVQHRHFQQRVSHAKFVFPLNPRNKCVLSLVTAILRIILSHS